MPDNGTTDKISDAFLRTGIDVEPQAAIMRNILCLLDKAQQEIMGAIAKADSFAPNMMRWREEGRSRSKQVGIVEKRFARNVQFGPSGLQASNNRTAKKKVQNRRT